MDNYNTKMEKIKIVVEKPLRIGDYDILPIVEYSISNGHGIFFSALKKPLAIVFISSAKTECFAIDGSTIPLREISEKVPDLSHIIADLKVSRE